MTSVLQSLPRQARPVRVAATVAVVVALCVITWALHRFDSLPVVRAVAGLVLVSFIGFAVTSLIRAARHAGRRRGWPWIWLTVGIVLYCISFVTWGLANVQPPHGDAVFPALALSGVWLPICCSAAMLSLPMGHTRTWRVRLLLDGLILSGSVFLMCWMLFLGDWYAESGAIQEPIAAALFSTFADLVALSIAGLMLARAQGRHRRTLSYLLLAVAVMTVSDISLVWLIVDHAYSRALPVATGWAVTMTAFGLAARSSLAAPPTTQPAVASERELVASWVPYALLILAGLIELAELRDDLLAEPMLGLGPLLVTAVLVRQVLVVGANRRLLATVADQAVRDPLTGVANRTLFNERLDNAIARLHREGTSAAVLVLDLDDFKLINDGLGHPAGDALIRAVAQRLTRHARATDTVARVGGDEFAILIEEGAPDTYELVAKDISAVFAEPFDFDGVMVRMRASTGLAAATSVDTGISADELLRRADIAMYTAKRLRTGTVQTFTEGMNLLGTHGFAQGGYGGGPRGASALQLLGELRHAIEHDELAVVYQPQCSLRTGEIACVEALLRWPHAERGLLEPDEFLPLVRHHGLMRPVTEWVLARALDDAAAWRELGVAMPVAVNIFAPLYMDPSLPSLLRRALDARGMTGTRQLRVEITEHLLVHDLAQARTVLETMRDDGIGVALDDFGSGYAALSYLRELPIDEVKLDRDFIAAVLSFPRAATIVKAVIDLAHHLDVAVVAEGVEDAQTAARLREFGCDLGQGYYHSPPVGAAAVVEMLTTSVHTPHTGAPVR